MSGVDNPGRERILERIRAGLRMPALPQLETPLRGEIFPPVADCLQRFQSECAGNTTECLLTRGSAGSADAVRQILASLPPGEVFAQDAPELRGIVPRALDGRGVRWSSEGPPSESSQATLTLAHALVASTGSILVSSACGGRGATIVAPCHIVLAGVDQIVPDLDAAMRLAYREAWGPRASFLGLITGCSRTADIEKLLVVGAHGPRRLAVVLQSGSGESA